MHTEGTTDVFWDFEDVSILSADHMKTSGQTGTINLHVIIICKTYGKYSAGLAGYSFVMINDCGAVL